MFFIIHIGHHQHNHIAPYGFGLIFTQILLTYSLSVFTSFHAQILTLIANHSIGIAHKSSAIQQTIWHNKRKHSILQQISFVQFTHKIRWRFVYSIDSNYFNRICYVQIQLITTWITKISQANPMVYNTGAVCQYLAVLCVLEAFHR